MSSSAESVRGRRRARMTTSVIAFTVATIASCLVAPPAAQAAGIPAVPPAMSPAEEANLAALLTASDNSGDVAVFDIDRALQLGAEEAATREFAKAFVESGGALASSGPGSTTARELNISSMSAAQADCRGNSGFIGWYWFGPQTALDSCLTTSLIDGIGLAAAGGGVYTAASALTVAGLPSSAVVGAVSAILALGVGFLVTCKDMSSLNAIYLNGGIPGVVPPSCWAQ